MEASADLADAVLCAFSGLMTHVHRVLHELIYLFHDYKSSCSNAERDVRALDVHVLVMLTLVVMKPLHMFMITSEHLCCNNFRQV